MAEVQALDKKELPSPENQGAWASATKGLLGNAKLVTDELFAALKDKDIVPLSTAKTFVPYKNKGPRNKADLDEQLSVTRFAVNTVDTAIQRTSQCILRLGHEQQKKWAPLKVCEWRVALRDRRPTRELFQDHVSEALDKEKKVLLEARVKLGEIVTEGKDIIEDCEANKARLIRIVRYMVMLGTTKLPALVPPDNQPSTPLSPSSSRAEGAPPPEGDEAIPSPKAKPVVPSDPAGLLRRTPQIEELVLRFVKKGEDAIKHHQAKLDKANEHVLACFQKRWTENVAVKKSLEGQIHEMVEAIESAEKSLERMHKRIAFFGEVDMQPKYDAAQGILVNLRESKEALEDDLHHKMVGMKIDESCRKITSERATGVDPMSLPITAMLEGPASRKKKMNRNNSSPAIVNGDGGRPGSPAGLLSPLKDAPMAPLA